MSNVQGRYVIKECGCETLIATARWSDWIADQGVERSVTKTLLGGMFVAEQLAHDVWVARQATTARDDQHEGAVAAGQAPS